MFSLICALNKRLSKQLWGWWFETLSRPLWRHCNGSDMEGRRNKINGNGFSPNQYIILMNSKHNKIYAHFVFLWLSKGSYTRCWQSLFVIYWLLCLGCCFYFWPLPYDVLSTDFAFRITDWTCCHGPHLHAILRIISRGVSGLATDSPCGVWGRGRTTCLLHDCPLFGSHFKMRVGM